MGSQSRTRLSKRTTANIVTCYVVGVYETHLGIPDSAGAGLSEVELLHCSFWPSVTTLRLSTVYECVPFQLLIFFFFFKNFSLWNGLAFESCVSNLSIWLVFNPGIFLFWAVKFTWSVFIHASLTRFSHDCSWICIATVWMSQESVRFSLLRNR